MVFNPTGQRGEEEYVLINPKIIHSNKRKDVEEEGCLSFPKIYGDVEVFPLPIHLPLLNFKIPSTTYLHCYVTTGGPFSFSIAKPII